MCVRDPGSPTLMVHTSESLYLVGSIRRLCPQDRRRGSGVGGEVERTESRKSLEWRGDSTRTERILRPEQKSLNRNLLIDKSNTDFQIRSQFPESHVRCLHLSPIIIIYGFPWMTSVWSPSIGSLLISWTDLGSVLRFFTDSRPTARYPVGEVPSSSQDPKWG